jgi:hypothetical protein
VDTLLAKGWGYTAIARRLPDSARLSARNVREHFVRAHLPTEAIVARRLVEASGGSHALVLEMGVEEALVQYVGSAVALRHFNQVMNTGRLRPTMSGALRASKMLADLDQAVRTDERDRLADLLEHRTSSVRSLLGAVKRQMSDTEWSRLVRTMDRDDLLRVWVPEAAGV